MIGVSFQPGAYGENGQGPNGQSRPSGGGGVQEAIKVLSLRLPKVVGAQAAVPHALLTGQGGGGNRVDSVVNQVLSRIMPQASMAPPMGAQPSAPSGPNFTGDIGAMYGQQQQNPWGIVPPQKEATSITYGRPRVTIDQPGEIAGLPQRQQPSPTDYGIEQPAPPASIGTLPDWFNTPFTDPAKRDDYA